MLSWLSLAHRTPPAEASHPWTFREDSLLRNGCADTSAPRAVSGDSAPETVIQDGGQGAVARDNAPGIGSRHVGSQLSPPSGKPAPFGSHEPLAAAPGGLFGESMCSRASSIGTSHTWQRTLVGVWRGRVGNRIGSNLTLFCSITECDPPRDLGKEEAAD